MRYWRSYTFWLTCVLLLLPSLLIFSLPGAIFIDEGTGVVKGVGILASENVLALLVPWLVASEAAQYGAVRKARNEQRRAGFPVVVREPASREAV